MIRRLTTCFAAVALTLAVTSTSSAVIEISMPTVMVNPGDTSATAILYVTGTDNVRSINPAVGISTAVGTGTATFAGPTATGDIKAATTTATLGSNAVFGAGGVAIPSLTGSPPPTATLRKYNLDNGVTVPVNGTQPFLALDIALAGVTAGSEYHIDLLVDLDSPPDGLSDSTWVGTDTSQTLQLGGLGGVTIGKIVAVPEPSAFALLGLVGCVGFAGRWARRRWFGKTAATE